MDPITIAMTLAQFAPSLIKLFTGSDKAEEIAGKVIDVAKVVTGQPTGAEAIEKLRADQALVLKFREAVAAQQADLEKAYLADVQSARARDVEIRKTTGSTNTRADIMVIGAVLGLISCLLVLILFRKDIPGEVVGIISTIAGIFGACLKDAFSFEFGSSRGSKDKDAVLASINAGGGK